MIETQATVLKDLATAERRYNVDGKDVWGFWFGETSTGYYEKADALWVEVDRPNFLEESTIRLQNKNPRDVQAKAAKKVAEAATGQKVVHVVYDP